MRATARLGRERAWITQLPEYRPFDPFPQGGVDVTEELDSLGALLATVVATPLPQASAAGETVAVNFVSLTIPFYVFMRKEAEDEAKKLDIKLLVQDAQFGTPKQGSDLENALNQGVDGIVVAPTDVKATAPAIDEVLKEGVPLIAVDRRVEGTSKPVPYVAADNVAGGRLRASG